jgi:glutamate--cysteine ligase
VAPTRGRWTDAARSGLADPDLRAAADRCFALARDALSRLGVDGDTVDAVDAFDDRFVQRGRCPADDRLDQWNRLQASTV